MSQTEAEEFLRAIATDVSVAEFTRALAEHPEWLPGRAPSPAAAPLPDDQLEELLQLSGLPAEEQPAARAQARDAALGARLAVHDTRVAASLVDSSLTTQQAADLLDRDPSNIRRGVQDHRYYAVRIAGVLRLPEWQFVEETTYDYIPGEDAVPDTRYVPLENLPAIVASIPEGAHPLVVAGFMATPQPELDDRTPIEWLRGGGEPDSVSGLLAGLSHR